MCSLRAFEMAQSANGHRTTISLSSASSLKILFLPWKKKLVCVLFIDFFFFFPTLLVAFAIVSCARASLYMIGNVLTYSITQHPYVYAVGSDPCGLFWSSSSFSSLQFPFAQRFFSLIEIMLFARFLLCVLFLLSGLCFHEHKYFFGERSKCTTRRSLCISFFIVRTQVTVYSAAF